MRLKILCKKTLLAARENWFITLMLVLHMVCYVALVDGNALSNRLGDLIHQYRNDTDLQMLAKIELNVGASDADKINYEIERLLINQSKSDKKMQKLSGMRRDNSSVFCLSACLATEEMICAVWCKK